MDNELQPTPTILSLRDEPRPRSRTPVEFDSNIMTDSVHPLLEEVVITAIPTNGDLHTVTPSTVTDDPQGLVVLAHNPSLKKRLSVAINRRPGHQRSASEFEEDVVGELDGKPAATAIEGDSEPVPLDPIVHPRGDGDAALVSGTVDALTSRVSRSNPTNNSQRTLKRVTDVSPVHERVAPSLASKNLLVKVVKADFIDLKSGFLSL